MSAATGSPKASQPRNETGVPTSSLSIFAAIAFGGLPTIVAQPPMLAA